MRAKSGNIFKMLFHFECLQRASKNSNTELMTMINEIMDNSSLLPDFETRRDFSKINTIP